MAKEDVFCPKCECKEVRCVQINEEPRERLSIDEFVQKMQVMPTKAMDLVMRSKTYRVFCVACGYSKEFTSPG